MERLLLERALATASEADSLALAGSGLGTLDAYLTATATLAGTEAQAYRNAWSVKAAISRVFERRHAAARAASVKQTATLDRLRDNKRRTERLIGNGQMPDGERDAQLAGLADERDRLERELARALPQLASREKLALLGPENLARELPVNAAFIDVVRYSRFEFQKGNDGTNIERQIPSYAAFVLTKSALPELLVRRVELGDAAPIDAAVAAWRRAIANGRETAAAGTLRRLVWEPLAKHLPPAAQVLYVSPAGDLARMPWCALPGSKPESVLLEEFAIAQVPHGQFLLEHLKSPRAFSGPESLLTLGDVEYAKGITPLPGTLDEVSAISKLAPEKPTALTKSDATAARLTELMPTTRYVHLATHGSFNADGLMKAKTRAALATRDWNFTAAGTPRRVAAKNPLGFVGLELANGDVMSGLSIVDLPLENVKLVTLSACETGLGDSAGAEGVQGLQRAFHLAGCPNVVASLWRVEDQATAALMALFYRNLWQRKQPPVEALRNAQLAVRNDSTLVASLVRAKFTTVDLPADVRRPAPNQSGATTAPTRQWAAFVLSGPGQ